MKFLDKFNIKMQNEDLIITALTHTSYANEHKVESYERLEFLGDAVLQILMSDYLYNNTKLKEGEMSKKRSTYVCEHALASYAKDWGYIPYIKVGNGQKNNVNDTIVADIFEALLGAIYLDQGIEKCREIIESIAIPYVESNIKFLKDYKSALQELVQTEKKSLEYVLIGEEGPSHDKFFTVEVVVDGIVFGRGSGHSKKEAEQQAAKDAYNKRARR